MRLLQLLGLKRSKSNVLVSYPKSGRTWIKFALAVVEAPVSYNHGGYATRDPKDLGYHFEGVKPAFFGQKTAFLHRNPIDVAVSEFHQIFNRIFNESHKNYEEMYARLAADDNLPPKDVDSFVLHPVWGCRKVCQFNRAHLDYFAEKSRAKIVKYEDIRADPKAGFTELLAFYQMRNFDIDEVVKKSSFDAMRSFELTADDATRKMHALYGMKNGDENSLKVRRGKVRGYVDELKPETVDVARKIALEYGFVA